MYRAGGLKYKLLQELKSEGMVTRKYLYEWSRRKGYEQATTERRIRELCHEVGVIPLNDDLKPADTLLSEHICAYKWRPTTILN